jgi:hypothetical protein
LFSVIKGKHVDIGEAAMIMCRQFKENYHLPSEWVSGLNDHFPTVWERIPDSALSELKEWWINNWYRTYSILEPQRHQQIMEMDSPEARQYQEWFNSKGERGHKMMRDFKAEPWWIK